MTSRTLVVTGGGTGGHIYPALAVADEMRGRGWVVKYVGTRMGLESRLAEDAGFPFAAISAKPFRRSGDFQNVKAVYSHIEGVVDACGFLSAEKPDVVFGTGGYASVPVCVAAGIMRIPVVLHEQNVVPGRANRMLAVLARRVFAAWPTTGWVPFRSRWCVVGMPVRKGFAALDRSAARARLGIGAREKAVLIFGGSRGASSINRVVAEFLPRMRDVRVIWATGAGDFESLKAALGEEEGRHRVLPYIDNMPEVMVAVDLAVTRAGAMTLAELAAAGVPAVLIPYPHAMNDHQAANAANWVNAGAGALVPDSEVDARLYDTIRAMIADEKTLARQAASARSLARPGVAAVIADALEELAA